MTDFPFFCDPDFNATNIEFDTLRKAALMVESLYARPIEGVTMHASTPATIAELELVHDPAYVDAVLTGDPWDLAESNGIGWDEGLFQAVCASTGGVRDALLWALRNRRHCGAGSSGLHHARYEGGNGFCTFNGLVVAARAALGAGAQRVLILDLDAHCGGGTASLIQHMDGVEQMDVSVSTFDRYRDQPNARLFLADGDDYLEVVERALAAVSSPETIDVVLYNAGMDPHQLAGGSHGITTEVIAEREHMVYRWAARHGLPVAFTFAGGYEGFGLTLDQVIDLHRITLEVAVAVSAEFDAAVLG